MEILPPVRRRNKRANESRSAAFVKNAEYGDWPFEPELTDTVIQLTNTAFDEGLKAPPIQAVTCCFKSKSHTPPVSEILPPDMAKYYVFDRKTIFLQTIMLRTESVLNVYNELQRE